MSQRNSKEYKEDFILLLEAGFVAVNHADEDSALKLFKAAELLNPTSPMTKLGLGYLYLHMMDLKKSARLFEEVLESDPHNDMAKAMLGIALSLDPTMTAKAEKVLEQAHHSKNKAVHDLSGIALDFVDKFIKKNPSPVEGTHKKK